MLALALTACGLLAARRLRELGKPGDWAYEMVVGSALVGWRMRAARAAMA